GVPGHSVHREIELYVEAGFTPIEALQAATIVPARAMKLDAELGTIEKGKRADLVVLNANPLDDIRNIRRVRWTIRDGRVYDSAALWRSVNFIP
ncbi:MAG TPA: amidohydrolase family protein, partial [Vicinamibacterales bacterium]|nr:amidohydrolase family protein [Vicinamibacterales bacterium]